MKIARLIAPTSKRQFACIHIASKSHAEILQNQRNQIKHSYNSRDHANNNKNHQNFARAVYVGGGILGVVIAYDRLKKAHAKNISPASQDVEDFNYSQLNAREERFVRFASFEYDGKIYMTPRDFIDSVTEDLPRSRIRRKILTHSELTRIIEKTPRRYRIQVRGADRLFRTMGESGLITYAEYLFLLSVLTKPKNGFEIAFAMFDRDGNKIIDKKEFLVIRDIISVQQRAGRVSKLENYLENYANINSKFGYIEPVNASDNLEQIHDTTLLRYFFGRNGTDTLSYNDFEIFYDNLQQEILQIEFDAYSGGRRTISELDFAKILLKYTILHTDDYREYVQRVKEKLTCEKGITFEQFSQFCLFLNNLDDFAIAIKLYTLADKSISQAEFARAVNVSTGLKFDEHVINTVYTIFDVDNDSQLSYQEFIAVMNDRIHRGFKVHSSKDAHGWAALKKCIRDEIRNR